MQDAPPQVTAKRLKLTRPEIYYGEMIHEPVFVRSGQKEFSYPSGNDSVFMQYDGHGRNSDVVVFHAAGGGAARSRP